MNIVHIIPGLSLLGGGGDRACAELAESQAALGHNVQIFYITKPDQSTSLCPQLVKIRQFKSDLIVGNLLRSSSALVNALDEIVHEVDIVHIHALWSYINVGVAKTCVRNKVPYIVQPHGSLEPWRLKYKPLRKRLWGILFEKRVLSAASMIHAECDRDKNYISLYTENNRIFISPCGVKSEEFEKPIDVNLTLEAYNIPENKKYILFLGRLDVHKGLDLLLQSFEESGLILGGYHLLIVGPDYACTEKRMRDFSEHLGIAKHVSWIGPIIDTGVKKLFFKISDFFVLPSYSENFGITVLEAMFCKCPVITSTETAWEFLRARNAGVIIKPNVQSLVDALIEMSVKDPVEKQSMIDAAYKIAYENYDWKNIAKKIIEKYSEAINV